MVWYEVVRLVLLVLGCKPGMKSDSVVSVVVFSLIWEFMCTCYAACAINFPSLWC